VLARESPAWRRSTSAKCYRSVTGVLQECDGDGDNDDDNDNVDAFGHLMISVIWLSVDVSLMRRV
jgi:hypothetical protein